MPVYEYKCPICQHKFEIYTKLPVDPNAHCPKCEEVKGDIVQAKRIMSKFIPDPNNQLLNRDIKF